MAINTLDFTPLPENTEMDQARHDLAACYQLAAKFDWTDLIYTHISARPTTNSDFYFIGPFGVAHHEVSPENLIKVDLHGNLIDAKPGQKVNPAGLVIHSAVHRARTDVKCVMHTHTQAAMALSSLKGGLLPLTQHACRFYNRIGYHSYEGLILDATEQDRLVKSLGPHNALILRNHGFLTAGRTVSEALVVMWFLEKAAKAQLCAQASNAALIHIPPDICEKTAQQFQNENQAACEREWPMLLRLLEKK